MGTHEMRPIYNGCATLSLPFAAAFAYDTFKVMGTFIAHEPATWDWFCTYCGASV